jgi:hypothetical protein
VFSKGTVSSLAHLYSSSIHTFVSKVGATAATAIYKFLTVSRKVVGNGGTLTASFTYYEREESIGEW